MLMPLIFGGRTAIDRRQAFVPVGVVADVDFNANFRDWVWGLFKQVLAVKLSGGEGGGGILLGACFEISGTPLMNLNFPVKD